MAYDFSKLKKTEEKPKYDFGKLKKTEEKPSYDYGKLIMSGTGQPTAVDFSKIQDRTPEEQAITAGVLTGGGTTAQLAQGIPFLGSLIKKATGGGITEATPTAFTIPGVERKKLTLPESRFLGTTGLTEEQREIIRPEKAETPVTTGAIAELTGRAGSFVAGQQVLSPIISQIPAIQAIDNPATKTLVTELVTDIGMTTGVNIGEGVIEGKSVGEIAKSIPGDVAIDLVGNLGFAGAGKIFRDLGFADEALEQTIKETVTKMPTEQVDELVKTFKNDNEMLDIITKSLGGESGIKEIQLKLDPTQVGENLIRQDLDLAGIRQTLGGSRDLPLKQIEETIEDIPTTKVEPKVDSKAKVLTESPKKVGTAISDKAERVYQELVSKNVPFERIGGDVKVQASNLNRIEGTTEYNILGKQTDNLGNPVGKSVVNIFEDVPTETKQDLFDYVLNKHNIDRLKEGKPVFGDEYDEAYSLGKVSNYEADPKFVEKQKEITGYFKNLMDNWAVQSGLVSPETAKMLQERYPNYVPTYRAKDLPKSLINSNQNIAQIVKKAKGGEDFILPIDQQMVALTQRTIKNARKNELMNALNTLYESDPSSVSRYIKEVKGGASESVEDLLDVGKSFDVEPVIDGDKHAVNFYVNGEPRQMVVNKTLYEALNDSVSSEMVDKIANTVNKYATKPFKNLVTGYNPIFAGSNIMRDVPTALVYSFDPVNMTKNVPDAVKEMLTNGEKWQLFRAMGGTRDGLIGSGKNFKVPSLDESKKVMDFVKKNNPISAVGKVNDFTESLPRFSEFLNVLEETGDPALAVYRSAELTTDFSRHGKLTKLVDKVVPYLNPSVQGIDKFFRSAIDEPLKTAAKGAAVISLPTMVLDQINKENDDYNNLTPRERNLYFNVPYTAEDGSQKFIRIPKSRELGVAFSSIYEWAARQARGQEVTGKEIAQTIGENFTPVDITAPIWTPAEKAWKQIKDPEAYETNYWGGLIVPNSQRKYSPGEQYDVNTSGVAKAIGQQFEISPYVVDYLIKSYGGIVGQMVQGADKGVTGAIEKKFITDPVFKSKSVNEFYDELDKLRKEAQDFNKQNDIPADALTPFERKANAFGKVSTVLSKIRAEQRKLQASEDAEKEEKIKKLQEQLNQIAEDAVRRMKDDKLDFK